MTRATLAAARRGDASAPGAPAERGAGALRVTFLAPGQVWVPSGSHRVTYEHANHLAARGHAVTVVHMRRLPPLHHTPPGVRQRLRAALTDLRRRTTPAPTWFALDPRVRVCSVPTPAGARLPAGDAVIATHWRLAEHLAGYPAECGAPLYLIHHDDALGGQPADRVDATWRLPVPKLGVSLWTCEMARARGIADVVHLPNGIDQRLYRVTRPVEGRPVRVAMGFVPREIKDVETGLRALERVRAAVPGVQAVLFGPVPRDPRIPPWVEYRRTPSTRALVEEVYNGSAAFLCSSRVEGFGLPGAEAMACGCAVVTTDCGGVRDYAEHGVTALLAPPGDAAGLAEHLRRVLTDPALRASLAGAGAARARTLTWERSAAILEEQVILAARGAPQ
ncbi:MAG: glycosyltransferase family 4 protein [Longimicrobiaceae bacterium]